jgi:hypothetical protein
MDKPDIRLWDQPVLHWNKPTSHRCYNISDDGFFARVKSGEVEYFSSAIADLPFVLGRRYYFEVAIRAEGASSSLQVKVGITTEPDMNFSYGFSDKATGWSYYLYESGYKRHNIHTMESGSRYGEGYKPNQILGVYVDLVEGYIAYSVDGAYYGPCYMAPELLIDKPLYAAVAMNNADHYAELIRKTPACWEAKAPALFVRISTHSILSRLRFGIFRETISLI